VPAQSAIWDRSRTFRGGYIYHNCISAWLQEHGHGRIAEAPGKVKSLFIDIGNFLGINQVFYRSSPRPHAGKK